MRNNWQRFQQGQHGGQRGAPPPQHNQNMYQPPQPAYQAAPQMQRDVVAFVETFRASQSNPAAPPNALSLDAVVRAICNHFRVNAFEELLGTSALQLPALRQLHTVNQRVWTFVTCFMQSRRVNTLFECQQAFLQHEGLRSFHELKIGNSFLHTEAVQQLYRAPAVVMKITTQDVLASLRQFEDMLGHDAFRASSHIDLNEFLQFLAQQYRQPSAQAMGVAIDANGFGVYVGMLRRVANNEMKEMKTLEQQFQREVAEKMFRLTKDKFSDDNRKQALDELLKQTNARSTQYESDEAQQSRRGGKKGSMQSLSLDMLKRVTDVDVYLDNVLRRKAAADAKSQQKFRKPISSQEIAETDSKLRNQLTRFLMSSQKSKHHSRLKVVTWVICSIMAKTYSLLLSDDKLPDEESGGNGEDSEAAKKGNESDKEECDCCCVGEDACTCSCTCKCHVESSDEESDEDEEMPDVAEPNEEAKASSNADQFPVMPTDPFARSLAKRAHEVKIDAVKAEVGSFLDSQLSPDDEPRSAKTVLLVLSSLEKHLMSKFSITADRKPWAGRGSLLDLLPDLVGDEEDDDESEASAGKWLLQLLRSRGGDSTAPSNVMSEKRLHEEVLPFIRDCRSVISSSSSLSSLSSEKQQQWISRRISVELGCACVEDLGLPSVEELIKLADQEASKEDMSVIKFAGSLDVAHGAATNDEEAGESVQQKLLTEQALDKLRKCPYLVDVSLYMDWQERYAPLCGSLLSFIRVHEMILLDHAPSNNFMFVRCLNGTILRVNEKSTPSDLELLLGRAQQAKTRAAASQVAVHLVSMVVTCKGQANFPKQLVQAHLRAYLSSFTKDKLAGNHVERFVVEVLTETPVEFAEFVASLLLGVVAHATKSGASSEWEVADQVWKACQSDAERKALVFISNRSSSPLWVSQTDKWCSVRENLSAAFTEGEDVAVDSNVAAVEIKSQQLSSSGNGNGDKVASLLDSSDAEVALESFSSELTGQEVVESGSPESSSSADSCRELIEDLRKKQFGVGLQIQDEATTSVLLIQQQRLERALKRLSDELYSESTHFVLELLQNADDNSYDDAVVPLGDFTLTADKEIVFYNNERGFSPANIHAICDVGASTKAAVDSEASIGKKGIGFKSVFKVSDDPQVHSNGFHICFHAKNSKHGSGMGYILPYWLDDATQWKQRRGTTFVLPLNDASVQRADDISQSLMAFEPSILLFLRRIRELRLRDSARQQTLHFLKKEKTLQPNAKLVQLYSQIKRSDNDVELAQQNWLVVKDTLEPPALFSRSHPTEIALAFPVACQEEDSRPPLQQVFAYLPLRSYGFRFILQGDFEIPSSREAITNGSEWNEWLVSKFPKLVRAAVSSYVSSLDGDAVDEKTLAAISHLVSLLPLENEVQAPFRSIVPEIMRELRQVKWLASASSSVGELLMPAELIDCIELTGSEASESMTALLEALSADVLSATFNKRFLHPALSRNMTAVMKSQLRIEQLHSSHLMRVLSLSAERDDIDWTVKILALLAKLWRKDRHASLLREELRLIKCFPLQRKDSKDSSTRWISLAEGHDSLFVPGVQANDNAASPGKSYAFYGDLRILDDAFTRAISKSSKLRTFLLKDVGVHVMEDHDLIRHHIIPKMASLRSTESKAGSGCPDADLVIEYGKFLSSHFVTCGSCPLNEEVKANMVVATSSRRVVATDTSKVFGVLPSVFKNLPAVVSWAQTKAEIYDDAFAIVSGEYFSEIDTLSRDSVDERWLQFFVNVCGLPLVFDVASLSSDERSQAGMTQLLKWIEAEDDADVKRRISTSLAQFLDKHWKESDSNAGSTESSSSTDGQEGTFDWWREYRWLEGSDGQFYRSTDLWLSVGTTTRLFTPAMVTFSSLKWQSEDFSRRVLGMKAVPTASDLLPVLSRLSVDATLVPTLDTDQMTRMYSFLWEESQRLDACREEIAKAFTRKMLLFVDRKERFIGTKSAVWSATAHNGGMPALETLYPKTLCEFFTEVCGVERKPSISFLCEMIAGQQALLSSKRDGRSEMKTWRKMMLPLLCALSKKVKKRSLSKTETKEVKKTLKASLWLPVRSVGASRDGLVFCSSKEQPVLASTESERKLQKLTLSLAKELAPSSEKCKDEVDIKMVQLEAVADGELDALLSLAKVSTLSAHLDAHASVWCKAFARFTELDSKKSSKKLLKLGQLLVRAWAKVFSASSAGEQSDAQFQWSAQHLNLFPTIAGTYRSAAEMYINDQADLLEHELQQPGRAEQLQMLGLFPWNFFVEDSDDGSSQVHKFLTAFCGMKSLKEHLQFEVSVLSTQHPASEAFHEKLRSGFALAQRFLCHSHGHLYDQLEHDSIVKLVSKLQCVLVDGHDGFQVVYRVGSSFSLRRGVDALSRCFLDVSNCTLYMQSVTGDEEATALSSVLMELSRKLFGAQVASSVANLMYLGLLQPNAQMREQWLVETQLLPPLPATEAGTLWVEQVENASTSASTLEGDSRKRASEDMEDGELDQAEAPMKKTFASPQQNYQTAQERALQPFQPVPPAGYGTQMERPMYPPLPPQSGTGSAYNPPLPPSSGPAGMQSLTMSNTMTKEEREAIGRWGEEYVFNQLKQQHAESESTLTVEWVNEQQESGLPYDLTLSSGGKVVEYIEVKSTRTMEKGVFEISMNELDQAAIHGSTYSIYRVFNAGNAALCRVIRMKNPVSLVRQRKIQLALVMQ